MHPSLNTGQIRELLKQAVGCLNDQQPQQAEAIIQQVLAGHPGLPQAVALLGVARLLQDRNEEAEKLLARALSQNPGQATLLFHLGGALRAQGKLAEAAAAYRRAVAANPRDMDARLALGATFRELDELDEAEVVYREILRIDPESIGARAGLGAVLNACDRSSEAEPVLISALRAASDPELVSELENELGVTFMQQRRYADAVDQFERALERSPRLLQAERNRATAFEYRRDAPAAAAAYKRVLAAEPLDLKTHLLLNELLHRCGDTENFLKSYDEAAVRVPDASILPVTKADYLLQLDLAHEALELYRRALSMSPHDPAAHIGSGRAHMALHQPERAIDAFEAGLRHHPNNADLLTSFAYCLLANREGAKALALSERAAALAPIDQPALSVLGLCRRVEGKEKDGQLNDFANLIRVFDLDPPEGYGDMADFNSALGIHLDEIHRESRAFFSQTLRGGTRSFDAFFHHNHDLRNRLKQRISGAITDFIGTMPNDRSHPFWGRRSRAFCYSGSWSSRMCDGGYHLNHIHSGWISSVYYVSVPDVAADQEAKQGWLKFGEPSHDIGLNNPVQRVVQPKPGRLVLFPSFMWHGTIPYHSPQARTTIAFDVMPH